MNLTTLFNKFNKFCIDSDFDPKPSIGLISPIFPHEFNVSAGHNYAMEILEKTDPITPLIKYSLFEKSFRRIDLERVGYSFHHLSFFQVALFSYAGDRRLVQGTVKEGISNMSYFLTEVLEIPKEKLMITVFDGGKVKNFNIPKEPFLEEWLYAGFSSEQIIPIKGRRNLVFSETEGAAICPTCEIFFDKGKQNEKSTRFVEIGSVNMYKYIYNQRDNRLKTVENWVLNNIVGIERLLLVLQNAMTIFDIDCIEPIFSIIEKKLQNNLEKAIYIPSLRIIVDAIRSITFICADGVEVNLTPQGKILKRLVKQLVSQMRYLQIYDISPIKESIEEIVAGYKDIYPNLAEIKSKIINLIALEMEKREEY